MNQDTPITKNDRIAVVGLGYVGLPLAIAFGRHFTTVGYDIDHERVHQIQAGNDRTGEASKQQIDSAAMLTLTSDVTDLTSCNTYIITVPTPIDAANQPDLSLLVSASETIGARLSKGNTVIYESTVYPGATEEICVPVLERASGLEFNRDFFVGYSPERINPGDTTHTLETVIKLTSGSTEATADYVDRLYQTIIRAGTCKLNTIQEAEAAKVIENIQRDVNIALMNELAQIFHRLNINTQNVLQAASTKWNFLPFLPGLVGGHCIGIDPYYLDHKARAAGYKPSIIPASRQINETMGAHVAERVLAGLGKVASPRILIMGLSFKENCPDLRNTKVVDIYSTLKSAGALVDVYDPWVDKESARQEYAIDLLDMPGASGYDAIVLAVRHQDFIDLGIDRIRKWGKPGCYVFDVKYLFHHSLTNGRL